MDVSFPSYPPHDKPEEPEYSLTPTLSLSGSSGGSPPLFASNGGLTPNPLQSYPVESAISNPTTTLSEAIVSTTTVPRVVSAPQPMDATSTTVPTSPMARNKDKDDTTNNNSTETKQRRQKRLQRNRESARLSRRRRKQYLTVLEEKVKSLGAQLDHTRRQHVLQALHVRAQMRHQQVWQAQQPQLLLPRTGFEVRLVELFGAQQVQSASLTTSTTTQWILWLTLQTPEFFRGTRASSERLSAARIGERLLSAGTDRVTVSQSLVWPLFCHEIALSYEQEEKVKQYQKRILSQPSTWLHRHTAAATKHSLQTLHQSLQGVAARLEARETTTNRIVAPHQAKTLAQWATRHRAFLAQQTAASQPPPPPRKYHVSPHQHASVNLYTIRHHLEQDCLHERFSSPQPPLFHDNPKLRWKLGRRPPFESLGVNEEPSSNESTTSANASAMMTRENSSQSLKRSVSEISMDDGSNSAAGTGHSGGAWIQPHQAQMAAAPLLEQTLGPVRDIIPTTQTTKTTWDEQHQWVLPAPTPVSSMTNLFQPALDLNATDEAPSVMPAAVATAPNPPPAEPQHVRRSSFLPPHLNVVPEEMWPNNSNVDDFLMNYLVDGEDWAIGGGIDMD